MARKNSTFRKTSGQRKRKSKKRKVQPISFYLFPNVFFIIVFAFILVSGIAIFQFDKPDKDISTDASVLGFRTLFYDIPHLKNDISSLPSLTARSVYVLDVDSGLDLLAFNPNEVLLPASTTKIATALVALAHYNLEDIIRVDNGFKTDGQRMGLVPGEQITVKNLLYGLLMFSGNDAAEILARYYPGGEKNFVSAMNKLAASLELTNTHFANPAGFDDPLHFSTARDLAVLATYAMSNPTFAQIVATKKYIATSTDGSIVHDLFNINKLVGTVPGVVGVKTGYTEGAKESLVTLVVRDGHRVIISLLGSEDRFGETRQVIDWIFKNYTWE